MSVFGCIISINVFEIAEMTQPVFILFFWLWEIVIFFLPVFHLSSNRQHCSLLLYIFSLSSRQLRVYGSVSSFSSSFF